MDSDMNAVKLGQFSVTREDGTKVVVPFLRTNLPSMSGGPYKGGCQFRPNMSDEEVQALYHAWLRRYYPLGEDFPAPDKGTSPETLAWVKEMYRDQKKDDGA